MGKPELAVVVLSCDKFSSLWPLFFSRFDKFFPECSFPKYLISNSKDFESSSSSNLRVIKVGEDISWSSNLSTALSFVGEQYVLLLMDDAPFSQRVDGDALLNILSKFKEENMDYINLKSSPAPNVEVGRDYGRLAPETAYRTSIVPSIWKKSTLLRLLDVSENAWQFEIFGSNRSKAYDSFFSVTRPFFYFDHIIIKGKIVRDVYFKLKRSGEHRNIDFPIMTRMEFIQEVLWARSALVLKKVLPASAVRAYRSIKYKS